MEEASHLFHDPVSPLLWYSTDEDLVLRTKENEDNVIPAANSTMARNYCDLGLLSAKAEWIGARPGNDGGGGKAFWWLPRELFQSGLSAERLQLRLLRTCHCWARCRGEIPGGALVGNFRSFVELDRSTIGSASLYPSLEGGFHPLLSMRRRRACQMPVSSWAEAKELMAWINRIRGEDA